jgi:hypothetical protein
MRLNEFKISKGTIWRNKNNDIATSIIFGTYNVNSYDY